MSYRSLEIWQLSREIVIEIHNSNDETIDHLETLWETGSLTDKNIYDDLHEQIDKLGKKLNRFIVSVENHHRSKK